VFHRNPVNKLLGSSQLEHRAGRAGHALLYAFMAIMPVTGIAMGLYGGKGLPFFGTTLGGFSVPADDDGTLKKRYGSIAKRSFQVHKQVGTYGKYLVPVHVGAAFYHAGRGQAIFRRINPFSTPRA